MEIGETLRETRMRRRIDMTEVEAATKIRAKYLRALENEEWDLLPGPTFVKTFLRTYAEYLDLGPAAARRGVPPALRAALDAGADAVRPAAPRRGARARRRRPVGPAWSCGASVVAARRAYVSAHGARRRDAAGRQHASRAHRHAHAPQSRKEAPSGAPSALRCG
jgi:hypothetical protein